jgi:4-amino-4-deoxy-L-arabinose transferase-like glycosyltransferase
MTTLADTPAGGATTASTESTESTESPESPAAASTSGPPGTSTTPPSPETSGGDVRPTWARPALLVLLASTAVLYLWGLGESGWANSFYSAAAQAGSESWKAFFFASSDSASSITVDKTPASVWVMALSVRLFGLGSWSILVPQALMGVASVALLHATVRRWHGDAAALVAGAVAAVTPAAVLMFRFNNPDALLVLSLVAAAYATVRAVETASIRWLSFAGALVGLGFMTKMLQALLVVPALALVWLVATPGAVRRRVTGLLAAGAALLVSAGWWVAVVELVPASMRPYIGGSQDNSVLELVLGYNGLGRLTGDETGSVGGGNGWGQTGWTRLLDAEIGGQVAWLLPAALVLMVAGLVVSRTAARTDRTRASMLLWGGWLLMTSLVFSFMQGIFHAYYTVALAPAIGALVGIGAVTLWRRREHPAAGATLALSLAVTACWSYVVLHRSADFVPWLAPLVLVVGLLLALALAAVTLLPARAVAAVAGLALVVSLAGPTAYAVQTASQPHTGSIPTAGPTVAGAMAGPGGPGGFRGAMPGGAPGGTPGGTTGAFPGGAPGGAPGGVTGGGAGGLLEGSAASAEMVALLTADADAYTWVAAAVGSNSASGYQLATGLPVMAIGGFNGSDPSPTLAQFQEYVAQGRIHYFIGGGGFGGMPADSGSSASADIAAWVAQTFPSTTVDGVTVYDLSGSAGTTGTDSTTST